MSVWTRVAFVVAAAFLGVVALMAMAPALLASGDPVLTDVRSALLPPSSEHWFGTDQSGRDVFTRVVYGARLSIGVGVIAVVVALVLGLIAGTALGTAPRRVDAVAMRGVDLLLALPEFLIALLVIAMLGPGHLNVAIAVTIAILPIYIRLARAHTRTTLAAEHVSAAFLLGLPRPVVLLRHVVPSVLGALSVLATIGVGTSMLAAAGLGFLGLGPAEPTPEWGLMLSGGRNVLVQAWWIALFPGLASMLSVLATAGDGRTLRARAAGRTR